MCNCGKGLSPREILNLSMNDKITETQIINAYKKCALRCHPDKYKTKEATEIFQKINNARDSLLSKPHLINARPRPPPSPQPKRAAAETAISKFCGAAAPPPREGEVKCKYVFRKSQTNEQNIDFTKPSRGGGAAAPQNFEK